MESLHSLYQRLTLAADERDPIAADDSASPAFQSSHILIGKLLALRLISADAVGNLFRRVWRLGPSLGCSGMGDNLFLFSFASPDDSRRVLLGGPWMLGGHLLLLRAASEDVVVSSLTFRHASFWVQLHEVPLGCMCLGFAEKAGNRLGRFLAIHRDSAGLMFGQSLRLKVELDVDVPLRRLLTVTFRGRILTVVVKYERLPDFCTSCGRIGHLVRDCPHTSAIPSSPTAAPEFGDWLRATNRPTIRATATPTSSQLPVTASPLSLNPSQLLQPTSPLPQPSPTPAWRMVAPSPSRHHTLI